MQRYFVIKKEDTYYLEQSDIHHFVKVMRGKLNEEILCIFEGVLFKGKIIDLVQGTIHFVEVVDCDTELDIEITLIYALAKGDKFDFVVQKATELGVHRIVPMLSNRCVVKMDTERFEKKRLRYQKIAKEACQQCLRTIIPTVESLCTIENIHTYFGNHTVIAYEETAKGLEHGALYHLIKSIEPGNKVTVIVGSEGGFDQDEVDLVVSQGAIACSLGKRILRSETAPLYVLSVLGYSREVM